MAWVRAQPRPAPKTITFKKLQRDGFLQPITIEMDTMITVENAEPGRGLQASVPFDEPAPEADDDAGLRFYRKVGCPIGRDHVVPHFLAYPSYP